MKWYAKAGILVGAIGFLVCLAGFIFGQSNLVELGGGLLAGGILVLYVCAMIKRPRALIELEEGDAFSEPPEVVVQVAEQVLISKEQQNKTRPELRPPQKSAVK
jgi:hypothetical protein